MNNVQLNITTVPDSMTLEDILLELSRFGRPRVSQMDSGYWHTSIEMFVTGAGVKFEIASSFKEPTPRQAARVVLERLIKTIDEIRKTR